MQQIWPFSSKKRLTRILSPNFPFMNSTLPGYWATRTFILVSYRALSAYLTELSWRIFREIRSNFLKDCVIDFSSLREEWWWLKPVKSPHMTGTMEWKILLQPFIKRLYLVASGLSKLIHFLRVQIASCHFLNGTSSATQTKSGISNFNLPLTALPWLQLGQKTWQVTYSNNDNSPPRAASHYVASHWKK